jgi:hypothetical protein
VNSIPTPDLTAFLREVKKIGDNKNFLLKGMTFDNAPWIITMKKNTHYFPTVEFRKGSAGWHKTVHEAKASGREDLSIDCET